MLGPIALLVLASAAPSAPAVDDGAQRERVAMVPILVKGEHGEATISSIVAAVRDAMIYRPQLAAISNEELFAGNATAMDQLGACGTDKRCIAERLREVGATLGIVVVVNEMSSPPVVGVIVLATEERSVLGESIAALAAEEKSIAQAIGARTRRLLEAAGYPAQGRIFVELEPREARAELDGALPLDRGSAFVVPGLHRLRVTREGFEPKSMEVEVRAEQDARASVALEPVVPIYDSPWFWVITAAAIAGASLAVIQIARPTDRCFCVSRAGAGCDGC